MKEIAEKTFTEGVSLPALSLSRLKQKTKQNIKAPELSNKGNYW